MNEGRRARWYSGADDTSKNSFITSTLKTIISRGTHDLPLRDKFLHEGILEDLIKLWIESGDGELKEHIQGQKDAA